MKATLLLVVTKKWQSVLIWMMFVRKFPSETERRRVMDDEDRKIIAYHEAGHAIVQAVVDDGLLPIHKVTIIPSDKALAVPCLPRKKTF